MPVRLGYVVRNIVAFWPFRRFRPKAQQMIHV